jgi:hypothetical protein
MQAKDNQEARNNNCSNHTEKKRSKDGMRFTVYSSSSSKEPESDYENAPEVGDDEQQRRRLWRRASILQSHGIAIALFQIVCAREMQVFCFWSA